PVPAVAVGLLPPVTPRDETAPALKLVVPEVAVASPVAPDASVKPPAVPLTPSPLKLAAPFEPVVAVALPSVAPLGPEVIEAVTVVPLWLMGLPLASCTCSTGC